MGWLVQDAQKKWQLGPNLKYNLKITWQVTKTKEDVEGLLAIPSKYTPFWTVTKKQDELFVYMQAECKFLNLRLAFNDVVGTPSWTLLEYSDVVQSNVVGDTEHPLVREVLYKRDGSGSAYFEPLHVQWMPVRHPFLDVIEVQLVENNGTLAQFQPSKTIATLQSRRRRP